MQQRIPYDGNDLGAVYTKKYTAFRLWAPTADAVTLCLYREGDGDCLSDTLPMKRDVQGTWTIRVDGDLRHVYYTYRLERSGKTVESQDPYSVAVGVNGQRSMVLDLKETDPENFKEDHGPVFSNRTDLVICEISVLDSTADGSSGVKYPGKYLGLAEKGTKNKEGEATGLDYLKSLGITHVQIMPMYDFASIDEAAPKKREYNWGYDPLNYNVPEGSFSTDPFHGEVRIREMKEMIAAFHREGIGVIMDVVYNHTFNTAESNFERTVPGYFYRQAPDGGFADASACGNETASDRPMMRKYMVESVLHWINEYHIDGFRFDLMGIHDIETMNEIRKAATAVDPTIFIYGEGWAASAPQLAQDSLAMKANTYKMPGIAAFSDEMRDALRGPFNDNRQGAFLAGLPGGEESIKFGIVGAVRHPQVDNGKVNYSKAPWAEQPTQMISYVSCHDDMCLVDRLKSSIPGITPEELARLDKLAQTAVFTSQGVPFIYAGEEVMRDKKGVHNSYQSPDSVNAIDWKRKTEHADVFAYYKGLIQLRKHHPAFRLGDAGLVRKHLEFLPAEGGNVVAYRLKEHAGGDAWGDIYVVLNARKETAKVSVPEGKYTVVCKDGFISEKGLGTMYGPEISVPAQSALIFYK